MFAQPPRATLTGSEEEGQNVSTIDCHGGRSGRPNVFGHVSAAGERRSSGVVYGLIGHRFYIVVAPDSWKARHVATGDQVSVTVPVRRGGILSHWPWVGRDAILDATT